MLPSGVSAVTHAAEQAAPNVLFIVVDDLRPELGCYGADHIRSPNIDALANTGRLFEQAYCQQAVCNPSRTSLMTGLRPDSIGVTGNHIHFRSNKPDVVTLSQHFMQHGYHAQSIGKIYHGVFPDGASKTAWDTMGDPQSWSVPTTRFGPRYYYTEAGVEQAKQAFAAMYRPEDSGPNDWTQKLVFGPMTEAPDVDDETLYDGKVAAAAIRVLEQRGTDDQPFFLAVGFIKPHSPFVAPKRYFDLYDPQSLALADTSGLPKNAPAFAGHGSGEIRRYTDQPNRGPIPSESARRMRHAYYACASYVDAQVGKLLGALEDHDLEDNTIVVLLGDHGYHLGEHGLWGKTTNFELDTHVPLIIRAPQMRLPGQTSRSLTELVDLYPTLASLAGLPIPEHCEGTNLAAVLQSPSAAPDDVAISQYPRGKRMGYSLRTDQWRYTEWTNRDTGGAGGIEARELYAHTNRSSAELENVADDPQHAAIVARLSSRLHAEISAHRDKPTRALKLPRVFGSHMVLQADAPLPVWGSATPGSSVVVALGADRQSTVADQIGNWHVRLPARKATAEPTALTVVSADERIELHDILIGEVWLCAGQSNMEWTLSQSQNARTALETADDDQFRLLQLRGGARGSAGRYSQQHLQRLTPETFCDGQWVASSADSARSFSAVAWYFGRRLRTSLDVPVGLICPAVGGTPAEAWIPREALAADPELKGMVVGNWLENPVLGEFCRERAHANLARAVAQEDSIPGDELGPNHSFKPGFMWEAAIRPLVPFALRGAIWYQGESNAETARRVAQHGKLLPLLIDQWRMHWKNEFPFIFAQLPALRREQWPLFRDQQRRMLDRVDNTGMAITIDTGHPTNVHPRLKRPVGERLAQWALGTTYKQAADGTSGPLFDRVQRDGGRTLIVSFRHTAGGLQTTDGKAPRHFEVSGADGHFHPATATLIAGDRVAVACPDVPQPRHVRYAWADYPEPPVTLVNNHGLPASPFTSQSAEELQGPASESSGRPNILLIVGEDHGCELSCYGDPVIKTPNIDRLAADGILFENGYVTQSVCSPSRSTLFTGLYPHQNGQLGLATHQFRWFRKWPTTYSLLRQSGYRTGLIGKTHVLPSDAVEPFVDFRYQPKSNFAKKKVAEYAVKAGEFFRAADEPFFMTVNYPDAHWPLQGQVDGLPTTRVDADDVKMMPYIGEPGDTTPRMRKVLQNYYDCMLRLDECVGQLLQQLDDSGKRESTLVIFIGDHGAQMARGKVTVYEGGLRVPFVARWPGVIAPQQRSHELVSTIDLLPTFADAAGISPPGNLPGQSLRPVFAGKSGGTFRQFLACERNCDAAHITFPQRTIRDARYKLIHSPIRDREDPAARYYRIHGASHWSGCLADAELTQASKRTQAGYARWLNPPEFQLYDLQADPHEWNNLASDADHKSAKTRLINALRDWQAATSDPARNAEKLALLMQETDALNKNKKRSPSAGWQYLTYWNSNPPLKFKPGTKAVNPATELFRTSFESGSAGAFTKRTEGNLTLHATGTVSISQRFAQSGERCLRMLGDAKQYAGL